jgi:hypothetical protein
MGALELYLDESYAKVAKVDGVFLLYTDGGGFIAPIKIPKEELTELIDYLIIYKENYEEFNKVLDKQFDVNMNEFICKINNLSKSATKKKVAKSGWVYILFCERSNLYKIGCTSRSSPNGRIEELRTANPSIIEIDVFKVDNLEDEKLWHKKFDSKRIDGEWFQLSIGDIDLMKKYYTQ